MLQRTDTRGGQEPKSKRVSSSSGLEKLSVTERRNLKYNVTDLDRAWQRGEICNITASLIMWKWVDSRARGVRQQVDQIDWKEFHGKYEAWGHSQMVASSWNKAGRNDADDWKNARTHSWRNRAHCGWIASTAFGIVVVLQYLVVDYLQQCITMDNKFKLSDVFTALIVYM